MQQFQNVLGRGFVFLNEARKFNLSRVNYFADLVFYNKLLHCYVIVELKRGKLSSKDVGQILFYKNYFDIHVKRPADAPTQGLLLGTGKDRGI